jgi:hypothetical protein
VDLGRVHTLFLPSFQSRVASRRNAFIALFSCGWTSFRSTAARSFSTALKSKTFLQGWLVLVYLTSSLLLLSVASCVDYICIAVRICEVRNILERYTRRPTAVEKGSMTRTVAKEVGTG